MSKKSQASKINKSIKSKKFNLKQLVIQNKKALGITDEGLKNIDNEMHEEYNYSHKGEGNKDKEESKKGGGGMLVESESSERDSELSSRESVDKEGSQVEGVRDKKNRVLNKFGVNS